MFKTITRESIKIGNQYYCPATSQFFTILNTDNEKYINIEILDTTGTYHMTVQIDAFIKMPGLRNVSIDVCYHEWVDTGMRTLVFCKKCNENGNLEDLLKLNF